jgi:hypothetical protein
MARACLGVFTGIVFICIVGVEPARAECTKDVDCRYNRVCEDGKCVEYVAPPVAAAPAVSKCTMDSECEGDTICEQGECVAAPAPVVTAAPAAQLPASPAPPAAASGQPHSAQVAGLRELELRDLMSKKRAGRGLLIGGIVAFVLGGAMQGGWALEECWTTGTNVSGYNESCELTDLGSALVISGFVLLAVGTAGIITGAVLLSKAKAGLRQMESLNLSIAFQMRFSF